MAFIPLQYVWRGIFGSCMAFITYFATTQRQFWGIYVKKTWNDLSLMEKVAWFFFFNQTIAIITLIEILLLK